MRMGKGKEIALRSLGKKASENENDILAKFLFFFRDQKILSGKLVGEKGQNRNCAHYGKLKSAI